MLLMFYLDLSYRDMGEDHLARPTAYSADRLDELLARGEIYKESTGIFTFDPFMSRLIAYFESLFLELAAVREVVS